MINRLRTLYKDLPEKDLLYLKKHYTEANTSLIALGEDEAYKNAIKCNVTILEALEEVLNENYP